MDKIKVYHGSFEEVKNPSLEKGRPDADFGIGFYVTPDLAMAEKWASRKRKAVINEYILDTSKLDSYLFSLDKEWLDFVIQNRNECVTDHSYDKDDLLIGATADDKLYATIEQYESGFISTEIAIEVLNCLKIGQQVCICTRKGLNHLHFIRSIVLPDERVNELRKINREDRKKANELTSEIIRNYNKKKATDKHSTLKKMSF